MGFSIIEMIIIAIVGPIFVVGMMIYYLFTSVIMPLLKYLFYSAWGDFVYFVKRKWIKWGPRRQSMNIELRKRNAEVYESMDLRNGAGQIRLLKLLPRERWATGEIHCEVIRASRGAHRYEALSYVWGDPALSHRIKVNGKNVMITQNLFTALKYLRADVPRTLWIDAICINQFSDTERSDQVQQMKYIFQDAINVIVWLGKAPGGFDRIHPLFSGPANAAFDWKGIDYIFLRLLLQPWWKRMWVVQELILASQITVQCGNYKVSWTDFTGMMELFWKHANNKSEEVSNARNMALTRSRWQSNVAPEYGLLSLAWQFREREAGDARDKLYALLGLLSQQDEILAADYSKSPQDVFMQFSQAWINHHKSLLIMNLAQRQTRGSHSAWYPVWSEGFQNTPEFFCGSSFNGQSRHFWDGRFSADGGREPPNCVHPRNKRILQLRGFIHGKITAIACIAPENISMKETTEQKSAMSSRDVASRVALDSWDECMSEWYRFALSHAPASYEEDKVVRNFYLAVTAGLVDCGEEMVNHEAVQGAACQGRRLFATENGELGLGPAHITPGDKVCVLLGSPVPFILSECKVCQLDDAGTLYTQASNHGTTNTENKGQKMLSTWQYVGDCYLHSIMQYEGDIGIDIAAGDLIMQDFFFCG